MLKLSQHQGKITSAAQVKQTFKAMQDQPDNFLTARHLLIQRILFFSKKLFQWVLSVEVLYPHSWVGAGSICAISSDDPEGQVWSVNLPSGFSAGM